MPNSINTNLAAYSAQSYIAINSKATAKSVARLSSGNRIVAAADDVAALSTGTSLRTSVTTLRVAKINTQQGFSVLQVADGGLAQITEILQRQKAIAVQASSGSLGDTERSFLDQEFQALSQEIDRLVGQTNFNGVKLLDGTLSERVKAESVTTASTKSTASLTFSDNIDNSETVLINGVTLTGVTGTPSTSALEFKIGATTSETVSNLANMLNNAETDSRFTNAQKLAIGKAIYTAQGSALLINARSGGTLGDAFRIDMAGTATDTVAEAGVGGKYGGTYIDFFQTGFSSSNMVVAAANGVNATPFQVGNSVTATIDSVAYTLHTVATGDSLQSIVNGINSNAANTGVRARLTYTNSLTYNIRLEYDDRLNDPTISGGANYANGTYAITAAGSAVNTAVYGLKGGLDNGLGLATTSVSGSVGNNVLTGLVQNKSKVTMAFPEIADADLSTTANFGNTSGVRITVGGHNFVFTDTAAANKAPDEITIGSTLQETLDNAVATINAYKQYAVGTEAYQLNQINVVRDGRNLVFESKDLATVTDLGGNTSTVSINNLSTVSTTNSGNLSNYDTGGVITTGISNKDFIGQISGFTVTPKGTDSADIKITIGNYTYTAQSVDTTPTSDTEVRLYSNTLADGTSGGYFAIELKANNGVAVSGSTDTTNANTLAARLDAAFGSLTFYQDRNIDSYKGNKAIVADGVVTGSLVGSSAKIQLSDFTNVSLDSISVTAPQGSSTNGSISFVVNGETFTTSGTLGSKLGANQTYKLTSTLDANKFVEFTTGDSTIDFGTDSKADAFEAALKEAFGVGNGSAKLSFQVGTTSSDVLEVGINKVNTDALFEGKTLNVLTQEGAAEASAQIDLAIKTVTSVRAEVGAQQSRFNFAENNIDSSIQNQDAARSVLLDTDISAESTDYATFQVKLQAGISVLAQANQQLQALLKLIG